MRDPLLGLDIPSPRGQIGGSGSNSFSPSLSLGKEGFSPSKQVNVNLFKDNESTLDIKIFLYIYILC